MEINCKKNSPNFTSVIKTQVFINGARSLSEKNIRKGIRITQAVLTKPAEGDAKLIAVKKEFSKYVKDLNYYGEKSNYIGNIIRNAIDEKFGIGYIFTGAQAEKLDELGRKIGPQKHKALDIIGTTESFESGVYAKKYFEQINDFINRNLLRVKERLNPKSNSYEGDEVVLKIYAKSSGVSGQKDFKIELDGIKFEKENISQPILASKKSTRKRPVRSRFVATELPETKPVKRSKKSISKNQPSLPFDENK